MNSQTSASLRVLLVDDDDLILRAGKALLGMLGHQVTLAGSGQRAIEILEQQDVDVVLLDMTMPVMSGKETFLEIHQRWPNLPVAICSGYYLETSQWLSSSAAAPPTLQKPYSVPALAEFLSAAVSKQSS